MVQQKLARRLYTLKEFGILLRQEKDTDSRHKMKERLILSGGMLSTAIVVKTIVAIRMIIQVVIQVIMEKAKVTTQIHLMMNLEDYRMVKRMIRAEKTVKKMKKKDKLMNLVQMLKLRKDQKDLPNYVWSLRVKNTSFSFSERSVALS